MKSFKIVSGLTTALVILVILGCDSQSDIPMSPPANVESARVNPIQEGTLWLAVKMGEGDLTGSDVARWWQYGKVLTLEQSDRKP